ncbi:hypothetical protein [Streptomyces sp. NPDC056192]
MHTSQDPRWRAVARIPILTPDRTARTWARRMHLPSPRATLEA